MSSTDFLTYGYAALVATGGIIGYAKAKSIPSLAMGLLFGSLIGFGAYRTSNNPNNYYLALGTSVALGGFMGKRYMDSGKIMPAGLIAAVSLLMVLRFTARAVGLVSVKKD
ncbi:transmembrane protein 14C-like [Daphnia pulicaria]|uniref:transmembrane protein 14C-like n=1 Tax=Daphnia pulicaria TaxID=35523 RepID=UPI001EEBD6A2|nr:transmembrane protein 14C-like [Daphnia pulicaria]